MRIQFDPHFWRYVDYQAEVTVPGSTVGACLEELFNRYPQLYVYLLDEQGDQARKTSLHLNDLFIWERDECNRPVSGEDVLFVGRDIPAGEGSVGKIIVGALLIVAAIAITVLSGGTLSWAGMSMFAKGMVMMGASLMISGVGELIMGQPKIPGDDSYANSTPTYTWSGIRNTTAVGTPISIVYGQHRVGGQLINVYTDVVTSRKNYLHAQIGLCEGEIESISDVEINKNPLSFYQDSSYEIQYRTGTADQTAMDGFNRVENTVSNTWHVGPIKAAATTPYQTSGEKAAVKVTVTAPALFYSGASVLPVGVKYFVEYKRPDDEVWQVSEEYVLSGASKTEVSQDVLVEFPQVAVWQVRVRRWRDLDDPEFGLSQDEQFKYTADIYLKSINEIVYDSFSYPHTAMLGLKMKATDQLSGSMPTITCLVKGTKVRVPNGYDPVTRTYPEVWDGTFAEAKQWTDNPVWCLYDLLTNVRYGLGLYYRMDSSRAGLMQAQMYLMAKYCDGQVPVVRDGVSTTEPRYTLNMVMDGSKSAAEWVTGICGTMQATAFYADGYFWLDIDRPKPMTQFFSMANMEKSSYAQQGIGYKAIPNTYEVTWPNPDNHYEMDVFRVDSYELQTDPWLEERKRQLPLIGVTRISQCQRLAKYALHAGRNNTRIISFRTGTEAMRAMAGDVIGIQHDVPQWGYGGRITALDGTSIQVSMDVELNVSHTYRCRIMPAGGEPVEIGLTGISTGVTRTLTLSQPPPAATVVGDLISVGVTTGDIKPFRVVSLKRDADEKVSVTCVEYTESIYREDLSDLTPPTPPSYTLIPDPTATSVTEFKAEERVYLAQDGSIASGIDCWYTPPTSGFWKGVTVWYGIEGSGVYRQTPMDSTGHVFIPSLQELYTYHVVAVCHYKDNTSQSLDQALQDALNAPFASVLLRGKTAPPSPVSGFVARQEVYNNNLIRFDWDPISDPDVSWYEIRQGSDWDTATVVRNAIRETYYSGWEILTSGTYTWLIKAVDTSNNYSENASSYTAAISVEPSTVSGLRANQVGRAVQLTWDRIPDRDLAGYEVRQGVSWDNSTLVQSPVMTTSYMVEGVSATTYRFMVKAFDTYGTYSAAAAVVEITPTNIAFENILVTLWEDDAGQPGGPWHGVKIGTAVSGTTLTFEPSLHYDAVGLTYDSGASYDDASAGVAYYYTDTIDLGAPVNVNCILDIVANCGEGSSVTVEVYAAATLEGQSLYWDSGEQWDTPGLMWDASLDYSQFYGGYVTARYVKFRLTLTSAGNVCEVSRFKVILDVPDREYKGSSVPVSAGGNTTITFPAPYSVAPVVNVIGIGGGLPRVMTKTTEYFTVNLIDFNGTQLAGSIDWTSRGY